jgi:hypothetical protein
VFNLYIHSHLLDFHVSEHVKQVDFGGAKPLYHLIEDRIYLAPYLITFNVSTTKTNNDTATYASCLDHPPEACTARFVGVHSRILIKSSTLLT